MLRKTLKDYDELFEYVVDYFFCKNDVGIICDYDMAVKFLDIVNEEDFTDYFGIDIQSDVDKYIVSKIGDEFFCIEPIIRKGEIISGESGNLIILANVYSDEIDEKFQTDGEKFILGVEQECYCEDCSCDEDFDPVEEYFSIDGIVLELLNPFTNIDRKETLKDYLRMAYDFGYMDRIDEENESDNIIKIILDENSTNVDIGDAVKYLLESNKVIPNKTKIQIVCR